MYLRRGADNYLVELGQGNGVYENYEDRLMSQAMDAVERKTGFHVHGSANATVCTFVSRTDADTLVVDAGLGHAGQNPVDFVAPGSVLALLDAGSAFATIGVAKVSSITFDSSNGQATINFASDIDTGSAGEDGDPLVFATSDDSTANNYVVERGLAPNGLLNLIDPNQDQSTFQGVTIASNPRFDATRFTSTDWGHVEARKFMTQLSASSNMQVSPESHVMTMHPGAEIELAKGLLNFQQQENLGRTLEGGWETVRVAGFDVLSDPYHLWDVVYFIDSDSIHVIEPVPPEIWAGDGAQKARIADYDGYEWFIRAYHQRITTTRNRLGAIIGVANPDKYDFTVNPY